MKNLWGFLKDEKDEKARHAELVYEVAWSQNLH